MNIAFLISSLHTAGGTERVTAVIANALARSGYCVRVFALSNGGEPFFELDKSIEVQYVVDKPKNNIYLRLPLNVLKLRRMCAKNRIDFLIDVCSAMSLMSIPANFLRRTRIITWEHFNAKVNWNPITSPLARRLVSRFAEKVVTLTSDDAKTYREKFGAKNVLTIHNPLTITPEGRADLSEKTVLAIGRLEEQKGFDMLLEAWARCGCRQSGWVLKIVGNGSLKPMLESRAEALSLGDSVRFLPPTHEIEQVYRSASIYAMSSRFEGLPLVLIEAMSLGLPIVSFDCNTGPQDIVEHGKTGFLVEANNVAELAERIDLLAADRGLREEFAENSLVRAEKFKLEPILEQWKEILK